MFEPLYQPWIPCSIFFYNFCLPLWVSHKLTSFNTILESSYYTWIHCSSIFLSHSSLSYIMIANGTYTFASNTWAISNFINPWIKYLLIISCKQVSPLIVLSINTPKPTRGLDALSLLPLQTLAFPTPSVVLLAFVRRLKTFWVTCRSQSNPRSASPNGSLLSSLF